MATFSNMISVFFLVFFVGIASSDGAQTKLTQNINHFVENLFEVVAQENAGKNIAVSPVTTNILLALLSLTAKGETLAELMAALNYHPNGFNPEDYKSMVDETKSSQKGSPQLALKVYINSDLDAGVAELDPTFKKNAVQFGTEAEFLNFTKQNEAAAAINAWVGSNTNNGIKDLINPSDLHNDSFVVLIDALSFLGDFEQKFNPILTWNDLFFPENSDPELLPTMHQFMKNFPYEETAKKQVLWMPIEGGYNLIITLPKAEPFTEEQDTDYSAANKPAAIQAFVALPKFHIETTYEDKTVLSKLGLTTMFTDKAELGLLANAPSKGGVTKSIKKTVINVDEEGVSAAIATGQVVQNKSPTQKSNAVVFIANKPFYYKLVSADGKIFISGKFAGKNS